MSRSSREKDGAGGFGKIGLLAAIAVTAVAAEKFWPKGVIYGPKEEWEKHGHHRHHAKDRRDSDKDEGRQSYHRRREPSEDDEDEKDEYRRRRRDGHSRDRSWRRIEAQEHVRQRVRSQSRRRSGRFEDPEWYNEDDDSMGLGGREFRDEARARRRRDEERERLDDDRRSRRLESSEAISSRIGGTYISREVDDRYYRRADSQDRGSELVYIVDPSRRR
jgi:hypothetical protein